MDVDVVVRQLGVVIKVAGSQSTKPVTVLMTTLFLRLAQLPKFSLIATVTMNRVSGHADVTGGVVVGAVISQAEDNRSHAVLY